MGKTVTVLEWVEAVVVLVIALLVSEELVVVNVSVLVLVLVLVLGNVVKKSVEKDSFLVVEVENSLLSKVKVSVMVEPLSKLEGLRSKEDSDGHSGEL